VAKKKGVNIYDIQPQVWSYEKDNYRAFVSIPGHGTRTSRTTHCAPCSCVASPGAGERANADELCKPEELGDALRYPAGGPTVPTEAAEKLEVQPTSTSHSSQLSP